MDSEQTTPEQVEVPQGFDPMHHWATPDTRFDMSQVKPHVCMVNVRQRGNYVHCYNGNHGVRLAWDEILVQQSDGSFDIQKIQPVDSPKPVKVAKKK